MKNCVLKILFVLVFYVFLNAQAQENSTQDRTKDECGPWVSCVTENGCEEINLRNFTSVQYLSGGEVWMEIHDSPGAAGTIAHKCQRENLFSGRQCFDKNSNK